VFSRLTGWFEEYLYAVVLVGGGIDALGIPFPGRLMLMTAGSVSGQAGTSAGEVALLIALATLGTVAGDHAWYLIGRFRGRRLFDLYCRVARLPQARIREADRLLRRFGGAAIVLAQTGALLRIALVPLAVSRGMSYGRFLALALVGAGLRAAALVSLGRAVGTLIERTSLTSAAFLGGTGVALGP